MEELLNSHSFYFNNNDRMKDDDGLTLLERRRRLLGQGGSKPSIIKNAPLADISKNGASKPHTIRPNITAPSQPKPPQLSHQQPNKQSLIHRQGPLLPLKKKIKTNPAPPPHNKPSLLLADSTDSDDDFVPGSFTATRVVTNQPKQQPDNIVKKITTATTNHNNNHNHNHDPPPTTTTTTTQRSIVPKHNTITIPPPPPQPQPSSSAHPRKLIQQGLFGHIQTITTDPNNKKKSTTTTHRGLQSLNNTNEEAEAVFSNRINLDKQPMSRWPGWCRSVQPYLPPTATATATTLHHQHPSSSLSDRKVIYTPDIMSSFSNIIQSHHHSHHTSQPPAEGREGGMFQGILLNVPQLSDCAGPGRITSTQLTSLLPLGDKKVLSTGILCIWAKKGSQLKEVFRCLKGWGFTYVENLTWVQLTPAGKIVVNNNNNNNNNNMEGGGGEKDGGGEMYMNEADNTTTTTTTTTTTSHSNINVACSAHTTLIMAKKQSNKETLELRHQRSCDVLLSPHLGGHQVPDDVRMMLETLLPDAGIDRVGGGGGGKKKKKSSSSSSIDNNNTNNNGDDSASNDQQQQQQQQQQQPLRLLELAFQGPDPIETGRRGWFKIIQQQEEGR